MLSLGHSAPAQHAQYHLFYQHNSRKSDPVCVRPIRRCRDAPLRRPLPSFCRSPAPAVFAGSRGPAAPETLSSSGTTAAWGRHGPRCACVHAASCGMGPLPLCSLCLLGSSRRPPHLSAASARCGQQTTCTRRSASLPSAALGTPRHCFSRTRVAPPLRCDERTRPRKIVSPRTLPR